MLVACLLDRESLEKWYPDVTEYTDALMKMTISNDYF